MNVHKPVGDPLLRPGVHPLDHLMTHGLCKGLTIFTPTGEQIGALMDRARADLPVRLADNAVVQRVARDNPDCFWALERKSSRERAPRGLVAMLMLNADGIDALIRGTLDTRNPPPEFLVGQNERPAAIYGWLIHAKGTLAPGLALVMEKLQTPLYRGVDIFCRASTKDGAAFFDALGFSRGVWWDGEFYDEFRHYRRTHEGAGPGELASHLRPPFDEHAIEIDRGTPSVVRTKVVHSLDEMLKVFAIRSAVYIEEQECPFGEEFDGNDFAGNHLLASVDGEPAGAARIRYFGKFAKVERLAVIGRYRHRGIGHRLVKACAELCRTKGYQTLYAHARSALLPFWSELGFEPIDGARRFSFSDHEYLEVVRHLEPSPATLAIGTGPYVLVRPEGEWDRPGLLEMSSRRGAAKREAVYR